MPLEATEDIRTRLRGALPAAIKARDQIAVAALRSALAAIDNAEAVEAPNPPPPATPPEQPSPAATDDDPGTTAEPPPGPGATSAAGESTGTGFTGSGATREPAGPPVVGAVVGLGAGEVERRRLTAAEMEAIVRREVTERRTAARAYRDAGRSDSAERLRAQADLLASYLDAPRPSA